MVKVSFPTPSAGPAVALILALACGLYAGEEAPAGRLVKPDTSAADSLKAVLSPTPLQEMRPEVYSSAGPLSFDTRFTEKSYAIYLDELFRLAPQFMLGDSLGNGYPRRFSPFGGGFAATGVYLDGMPLNDPLTGAVDWRMLAPEVLSRASVYSGGTGTGYEGWADEVFLAGQPAAPAEAVSRMGIAGGAYGMNKVSGGLRRKMFSGGALHVQINKIQQNTEDFRSKVEHIQYYTRLEQKIGDRALLSADGLFFSNDHRTSGIPKLRTTSTHLQTAISSISGSSLGYRLAYNYAASQQPFSFGARTISAGAASHGLAGRLWYSPVTRAKIGLRLNSSSAKPLDFPADSVAAGARHSMLVAGAVNFEPADSLVFDFSAGIRSFSGGKTAVTGSAGFRARVSPGQSVEFSWSREALAPSLALMISRFRASEGPEEVSPARLDHLAADWRIQLEGGYLLRAGLFRRKAGNMAYGSNSAVPLLNPYWRVLEYSAGGVSWQVGGPLFWGFDIWAAGIELIDQPPDVPYLPERRLSAVLSQEGQLYGGNLGWTLRAELTYDGNFRYPVAEDPAVPLFLQKGRANLGGAASLRVVDFDFYVRVDYLLSDYYNSVDPLKLPGPRGVFGVHWLFLD